MKKMNIPVGVSDFEEIRKNGYYYIDKSGLIGELLSRTGTKVTLITRPRRFGKTLGMSTLENFFSIRKDSAVLFQGLGIMNASALCQKWMNQCPTIFLSFKDVDGLTFDSAYGMLEATIAELFRKYTDLLDSENVNDYDKEAFRRILKGEAGTTGIKKSLSLLMRMLSDHYGKQVVLLLDEYDVPVAKASNHHYYQEMLEVVKAMMSTALKDNNALQFAIITGCLKIAKESIFTGTNNFVSDTITSSRLNEYFGFTQDDVDRILRDADAKDHAEAMKYWYDGYHFGDFDVYCPWDVMNYLFDLSNDPKARPASYWKNTSDNAIIRSFIDYSGSSITGKLETLLAGGTISQKVEENLTYDLLHSSEENLWSILYLTGYLTGVRGEDQTTKLMIPNAEIREIFESTVVKWFQDKAKGTDRRTLFHAVWNGDSELLTREMSTLLRMTISYHDYKEDFYHAFLAGIFAGAGYMVESNREHGEGRSDVIVCDSENGRLAVFEVKCSAALEKMEESCETALRQIDERMYAKEFEDSYDQVLCYGISFYKKRCLVKKIHS